MIGTMKPNLMTTLGIRGLIAATIGVQAVAVRGEQPTNTAAPLGNAVKDFFVVNYGVWRLIRVTKFRRRRHEPRKLRIFNIKILHGVAPWGGLGSASAHRTPR